MSTEFLTPISLWQGFTPLKENLNISVVSYQEKEKFSIKKLYITGISGIRIFIKIACPLKGKKSSPVILYINDLEENVSDDKLISFSDGSYAVATFDYLGEIFNSEHFTIYTEDTAHAKYENAKEFLNLGSNIKESAWYLWARLARRVITFLCSENKIQNNKIFVAGNGSGSLLATHISGVDDRICGLAIILGYSLPETASKNYMAILTEDNERWLSALSMDAYANLIKCPTLIISASNNPYAGSDKSSEILDKFDFTLNRRLSISPRTVFNIHENNFNALFAFAKEIFKDKELYSLPLLEVNYEDGFLNVTCNFQTSVQKASLFISHSQTSAEFRNWCEYALTASSSDNLVFNGKIKVSDFSDEIFYFANASISNFVISSYQDSIKIPHKEYEGGNNHILYEGRYGTSYFTIESDNMIIPKDALNVKKGILGIPGITVNEGILTSFITTDMRFKAQENSVLRFDFCMDTPNEICVRLFKLINGEIIEYNAYCSCKTINKWDKVSLQLTDFKNDKLIVLKDWDNILKLQMINAQNVLFNNILWV